jgi:hypothetical protein
MYLQQMPARARAAGEGGATVKPETCVFLAICIAFGLLMNKVELRLGWRIFITCFFLAMIYFYGYCCR